MNQTLKLSDHYRKDLKRSLVVFGIVPVAVIVLIFYNLFFVISYQVLKDNAHEEGKVVADELIDKFSQLATQSMNIAEQLDIHKLDKETTYRQEIYEKLYSAANENNLKSLFSVINTEGNVIATNWVEADESIHQSLSWYLNNRYKKKDPSESFMYPNRQVLKNDRIFYNIANAITDEKGNITGYIVFSLLENKFRQQLNNVAYTDIVVTDQFENSIITSNEMLLTQAGKLKKIDDNGYITNNIKIMDKTIQVHSILYIGLLQKIYKIGLITLIILFVIVTIGTILFANHTTRKKMHSIEQLLKIIAYAKQGRFKQKIAFKKEDEFQIIGEYVQQLLQDIERLMKENNESIQRSAQSELKQLETQIDPHFLFNTLENIKYITRTDPPKAERLIVILSNLLRYSINNVMQFNRLEADINYLKDYLALQQIRFGDALTYNISVQEGTELNLLPKLMIQPFVENSIKYGFQTKVHLKIDITIKRNKKALYIMIRDNGEGIEKEKLKQIKDSLLVEENGTNHIGIHNVNRRIQLLYGKHYGTRIFSEEGIGTLIVLRLPLIKEGDYGDQSNYRRG